MTTTIVYRPFTADDAPAVSQLALLAWQATYRDIYTSDFIAEYVGRNYAPTQLAAAVPYLEAGEMFFDVACDPTAVVGFCHIGLTPDAAVLYRIYLHPDAIGRGIGGHLLHRGEDFVRAHRRDKLTCHVHARNELGKRFYQRQGFQHLAEYDQDEEWFMEKDIASRMTDGEARP